jgi:hypothetical protein
MPAVRTLVDVNEQLKFNGDSHQSSIVAACIDFGNFLNGVSHLKFMSTC